MVLLCAEDGPQIKGEREASDILSAAWAEQATLVAIPVARLDADFFSLSTGTAGNIIQKFVNYQMQLAIIGDISRWMAESTAFRDFVVEANRGQALWFVADLDMLEARLATRH
jgi:hypothetical protein